MKRCLALLCLLAGAFFAVDLASWHVGIEQTRLANATLFGNSGSVILMAWGIIAARRAPSGQEGVGVLAALVGAGILLGRSLEISATTFVGDLFCLAAGIFYAFYLLPAQRARAALGPWAVLLLVSLIAAPLLLAIALAAGEPVWPGEAGWTPVLVLALRGQLGEPLREAALDGLLPFLNIYLSRAVLVEDLEGLLEARGLQQELEVLFAAVSQKLDDLLRVERKW